MVAEVRESKLKIQQQEKRLIDVERAYSNLVDGFNGFKRVNDFATAKFFEFQIEQKEKRFKDDKGTLRSHYYYHAEKFVSSGAFEEDDESSNEEEVRTPLELITFEVPTECIKAHIKCGDLSKAVSACFEHLYKSLKYDLLVYKHAPKVTVSILGY